MKILLDARMYGLEHGGIGRYVENLIENLIEVDNDNSYLILLGPQVKNLKFKSQNYNSKVKTIVSDIPHYSLQEQLALSKILNRLDFDVAHFPHFNVPLFFNRPFVLTIHDLIKHSSRGMRTTTRSPFLYWLKYFGYKRVFNHAIKNSKKIIVPSNAVKNDLLNNYKIPEDKVAVTYEGVDDSFKSQISSANWRTKSQSVIKKYKISEPYIIYTGSVYPHKNIERLVEAIMCYRESNHDSKISLIVAGSRNVFLKRIMEYSEKYGVSKYVKFLGFVPDEELAVLYGNAKAFVFPSLSEGFGLPGLEAMASGCPVICSDIPVFREIYGDAAKYFNPNEIGDIERSIRQIWEIGDIERSKIIQKGKEQANKFSWKKMVQDTLGVYTEVVRMSSLR